MKKIKIQFNDDHHHHVFSQCNLYVCVDCISVYKCHRTNLHSDDDDDDETGMENTIISKKNIRNTKLDMNHVKRTKKNKNVFFPLW